MPRSNGRYLIGLGIIAIGIIALLNNFGVTRVSLGYLVNLLWPILLAAVGINFIINRHGMSGMVTGGILICLGAVFLGRNAGLFSVDMNYFRRAFWPLIIILIGISLLDRNQHDSSGHMAIMGSLEKKNTGWELKSGEYTAVMGGIELDIRKASFSENNVSLVLTSIMGGITIIIPEDVMLTCKGTSILGGIDILGKGSGGIIGNTSIQIGDAQNLSKALQLNCTCIMGGIEIKR